MANVTPTTAAKFIPEVWKAAILDYAERAFRIRNQVTNVSDLVSGDTVHVPRVSEETAAAKSAVPINIFPEPVVKLSPD